MPKESLSIKGQVEKLKKLGLLDTRSRLESGLMTHGYFRLSGYWRFFQVNPAAKNNVFQHGTEFSTVLDIYLVDTELRNLLLEGLAEFEIALRSSMVANMCVPGDFGTEYLDPHTYKADLDDEGRSLRDDLIKTIEFDLERSKERHVVHYRKQGLRQIPLWVAMEALSIGTVSRMFGLWNNDEAQSRVAKRFGYDQGLQSAAKPNFRAISVFRNVCAHHGRIWNRVVHRDKPRLFKGAFEGESDWRQKYAETTWGLIRVLCHLVENIRRNDSFSVAVNQLVATHPDFKKGLTAPDRTR